MTVSYLPHLAKRPFPRRSHGVLVGLLAAAALVSCRSPDNIHLSDAFLTQYATRDPTYDDFYECHGFGCTVVTHIGLSDAEWRQARAIFEPPPADPREERQRIAEAMALLQRDAGLRSGTFVHQWTRTGPRIHANPGHDPSQLDCIDEAVNTWTYLTMLAHAGALRFHTVEKLAYAGGLFEFRVPVRNTAVIRSIQSAEYFVVDPTLVDEGDPPPIFPLAIWAGAWPPAIPANDEAD